MHMPGHFRGCGLGDVAPCATEGLMAYLPLIAGSGAAPAPDVRLVQGDQQAQMNGATKEMRAGDIVMRDDGGICCSIIYGQDNRSPISAGTTYVLYVAYAPPAVPADVVNAQMQRIEANIRLFAPAAIVEQQRLITA